MWRHVLALGSGDTCNRCTLQFNRYVSKQKIHNFFKNMPEARQKVEVLLKKNSNQEADKECKDAADEILDIINDVPTEPTRKRKYRSTRSRVVEPQEPSGSLMNDLVTALDAAKAAQQDITGTDTMDSVDTLAEICRQNAINAMEDRKRKYMDDIKSIIDNAVETFTSSIRAVPVVVDDSATESLDEGEPAVVDDSVTESLEDNAEEAEEESEEAEEEESEEEEEHDTDVQIIAPAPTPVPNAKLVSDLLGAFKALLDAQ